MLAIIGVARRLIPAKFRVEMRVPEEGRFVLQLERGVGTTKLQPFSNEETSNNNGSIIIENFPSSFVLALENSFSPQTSCTSASEKYCVVSFHCISDFPTLCIVYTKYVSF